MTHAEDARMKRSISGIALVAGGIAAGTGVGVLANNAYAGHTLPQDNPGACHFTLKVNCRTNYTIRSSVPGGAGGNLPVRNIVEWQYGTPEFELMDLAALEAEDGWNEAPGPQKGQFDRSPKPGDTWNYLNTETDPMNILLGPPVAVTYRCNETIPGPDCTPEASTAVDIQWADIYFDFAQVSAENWTYFEKANMIGHEFGHTLGLWHHQGNAIMQLGFAPTPITSPTSFDVGSTTDCRQNPTPIPDLWGVRCVYGWYETPVPTSTPYPSGTPGTAANSGPGGCTEEHRWKC